MEQNIDKTSQEILEIYKALPKLIQDAITKSGWEKKIRDIVTKYKLRVDQGTQLENMVFGLMMGQLSAEKLYSAIVNDFELGEDQGKLLFQDVDDQVFGNIEDLIMKLEIEEKGKEIEANKEEVVVKEAEKKIPTQTTWKEKTLETDSNLQKETETFLREGVESATSNDKILTVTRDEILQDIEEPEKIGQHKKIDVSVAAEGTAAWYESTSKKTVAEEPKNETSEPVKAPESTLTEPPNNLPDLSGASVMPGKEQVENSKPVDPVEANLSSKVSTSKKDYKSSDPYREPIQ
jgi:hypothetical protein